MKRPVQNDETKERFYGFPDQIEDRGLLLKAMRGTPVFSSGLNGYMGFGRE